MNGFLVVALAPPVSAVELLHLLGDDAHGMSDPAASAHALLRRMLSEVTGLPPSEHALARRCATCRGPHGKPYLPGLELLVSLSYTDDVVAVAVSSGPQVGIDVERIAATDFHGFADVALAPSERATSPRERARLWTCKEAYLKATGTGLAVDPRSIAIDGHRVRGRLPAQLYAVPAPNGLVCSVAVLGRRRPRLTVQHRDLLTEALAPPVHRARRRGAGQRALLRAPGRDGGT